MSGMNPFDPEGLDELPGRGPVFPLASATLLPGTTLALNIFEPRYLNMILDAFAEERLIGMLQPDPRLADENPPGVFKVGCAGRITAFNETEDGRLLITLYGVCRFRVRHEIAEHHGYRRMAVAWLEFAADLPQDDTYKLSREIFKQAFTDFFNANGIRLDWPALAAKSDRYLVDFLSMNLPFSNEEKQALLEAPDTTVRCRMLLTIVRMAGAPDPTTGSTRH